MVTCWIDFAIWTKVLDRQANQTNINNTEAFLLRSWTQNPVLEISSSMEGRWKISKYLTKYPVMETQDFLVRGSI